MPAIITTETKPRGKKIVVMKTHKFLRVPPLKRKETENIVTAFFVAREREILSEAKEKKYQERGKKKRIKKTMPHIHKKMRAKIPFERARKDSELLMGNT